MHFTLGLTKSHSHTESIFYICAVSTTANSLAITQIDQNTLNFSNGPIRRKMDIKFPKKELRSHDRWRMCVSPLK